MEAVLSVLAPIFWGALVLSALVFVHEGGHFLAARACGVRVTEFFLGFPCRFNIHHVSRRIGTKFGVTPVLVGGYAAICGMEPEECPDAPAVLALVHRRGTVTVAELSVELGIDEERALDACAALVSWGSIAPVYDEAAGEREASGYLPSTFAAMPRDAAGNTVYDGRAFVREGATEHGGAWEPAMGERAFYEAERSRTYMGKGFWARAAMLLAGIFVNIVTGFIIMVFSYSVLGTQITVDRNQVGTVDAGSPAEEAGLVAGDTVVSIDGVATDSWTGIVEALDGASEGQRVEVAYERDDVAGTAEVTLGAGGKMGITAPAETMRLSPVDSVRVTCDMVAGTAQGVLQLLQPQHTMEVLQSSSSVVGISVMSAEAAASGPATLLNFAALISFSLAFMNLLPIPPLDGGKLLIEVIQAVTRKTVPTRVQNGISYVGFGLFMLLFVFMLRQDILRLL